MVHEINSKMNLEKHDRVVERCVERVNATERSNNRSTKFPVD